MEAQKVWLIQARFKNKPEEVWVTQALSPLFTVEDAEAEVDRLMRLNTLSYWRAVIFVSHDN